MADLNFEKMVVEMLALTSHTEGIVGLRMDGGVMPWPEVIKLYLPSWRDASFATYEASLNDGSSDA